MVGLQLCYKPVGYSFYLSKIKIFEPRTYENKVELPLYIMNLEHTYLKVRSF
jgi:hypothetical protein